MENFLHELYVSVIADNRWMMYLTGLKNTFVITILSLLIGLVIGICIAIIKNYEKTEGKLKILAKICDLYLVIIRGTPVLIQLMIIYFSVFASMSDGTVAAVIGFGINSGAYMSEIIRSGLLSVGTGQSEAGRSLGLSKGQTMRFIVLPQALKNSIPPLFNEFISLLKETSVAGMIAVPELTKISGNIRGRAFVTMPLYIVAILYLLFVVILTLIQRNIERRLAVSDKD